MVAPPGAARDVRLLLDEMHTPAIADELNKAGFDVVAVAAEPSLRGRSDAELLDHATATGHALVTENIGDFSVLLTLQVGAREPRAGLIFTNPNRYNRASLAYPGNVIAALAAFLTGPPVDGESWVWWL